MLHSDQQGHRLAKAGSAGQLVRAKSVKAAIGRNEQELIRRLRVKSKGRSVPFLELELVFHAQVRMTLHRANPAALRHDDRDGLPLDHGFQRDFPRSEEHTSELQSLMRISYAVFCLKKKTNKYEHRTSIHNP